MPFLRAVTGAFVVGLICWVRFGRQTVKPGPDMQTPRRRRRRPTGDTPSRSRRTWYVRDQTDAAGAPMMARPHRFRARSTGQDTALPEGKDDASDAQNDFATRMAITRNDANPWLGSRTASLQARNPQFNPEPLRLRQAFVEQVRRAIHEDR